MSLSGCAYPHIGVNTTDDRASVGFNNAPEGAILMIDGLNMGLANSYDGKNRVLLIEPGTHKIEIIYKGKHILSEQVFLGDGELKVLSVNSGGIK